jgi:hypothetical protein
VVVSVYAALVGSAALVWQVVTWRRSRNTIVGITLSLGWHFQPTKRASVQVRIVNRGDHPITVEQVSIEGVSGSQIPSIVALGGWRGRVVPALDGIQRWGFARRGRGRNRLVPSGTGSCAARDGSLVPLGASFGAAVRTVDASARYSLVRAGDLDRKRTAERRKMA